MNTEDKDSIIKVLESKDNQITELKTEVSNLRRDLRHEISMSQALEKRYEQSVLLSDHYRNEVADSYERIKTLRWVAGVCFVIGVIGVITAFLTIKA